MFTYVCQDIKRAHLFISPQDIIHSLFYFFLSFSKYNFARSIQLLTSLFKYSSRLIDIALSSLIWFILSNADAKLLKQQLCNDFWQALGYYCKTWFFHTFLISNSDFKPFKCICILCCVMPLKDFPIEVMFMCAKIYFNPIKFKMKPTVWSCRLTLKLEFRFIFILIQVPRSVCKITELVRSWFWFNWRKF